ncbi:hypothetical protein ATANTOWER_008491 [Ataeniobius toweri]|uniref:Uncharacterized protein n=1 Tax=Ataeniobius toweri TaxID=208326 RepID=A0ABU7BXF0_9TELE|nr:hypothetical protein [Ataeniobius toweri]
MRPPRHVLHPGPASKPTTLTVGTSQKKDQAAGEEMITQWEYLRRAAEKSSGQAREKEEQQSPFWGLRLAILQPDTSVPASVPALFPVQPPTTPPASAISEGSADTPASVSAGIQQDTPAFVSAGGQPGAPAPVSAGDQPDISASVSAFPDQPPATATQLFLPTHFLGFLCGILSEVFGGPVPASAVGRRDTSAPASAVGRHDA